MVAVDHVGEAALAVRTRHAVELAGEAALDHLPREQAHVVAESRIRVAHRHALEDRVARSGDAKRRADVERGHHLGGVDMVELCHRHRGADRPGGRMRMEHQLQLRCAAHPRRSLVAEDEREQHVAEAGVALLGGGERRGGELDTGVAAARMQVALVLFQPGAGHAVDQRRLQRLGAASARQHRGRAVSAVGEVLLHEGLHLGHAQPPDHCADAVGHDPAAALDDLRRQVFQPGAREPGRQRLEVGRPAGQSVGTHHGGPFRRSRAAERTVVC